MISKSPFQCSFCTEEVRVWGLSQPEVEKTKNNGGLSKHLADFVISELEWSLHAVQDLLIATFRLQVLCYRF